MRFQDLLRMGMEYAVTGIMIAVFAVIIFALLYKIVYQKMLHGTKKLGKWKTLWIFAMVIYGVVILGATFMSRGGYYSGMEIVPPFASYREAWYQGKISNVRNIAVNILLFVPFGVLLPLGIKKARVFWKTYLVGLLVTIGIESLQFVTGRGIFEFDDILNNLLGVMIGYGIYEFVSWLLRKEEKRTTVIRMLLCQIPLILYAVVVTVLFLIYQCQELGTLDIHYVTKIPNNQFEIVSDRIYSEQEGKAFVYCIKEYNLQETREIADKLLKNAGTEVNDNLTIIYDETVFYRGHERHVSVDYYGGLYEYIDFEATFSDDQLKPKTDATQEEIQNALLQLGVEVPNDMVFQNNGDGKYAFIADTLKRNDVIYDGSLTCDYMEDGSVANIRNNLYACTEYKEFDIISEKQAYQNLLDGAFRFYFGESEKELIEVLDLSLAYRLDSKLFYQPVYVFDVMIEEEMNQIVIPAIK